MEQANTKPYSARILIIDDDTDVLVSCRLALKKQFMHVRTENDPERIREIVQDDPFDVILLDMNFKTGDTSGAEGLYWLRKIRFLNPDAAVIMMTAFAGIDLAVQAMKEGAVDFVTKPWENKNLIATVYAASKFAQSRKEIRHLRSQQLTLSRDLDSSFSDIIGVSPTMGDVFSTLEKVGPTDVNVLILGENGTGKELVARALHRKSNRRGRIFLSVDMGAISESLFESELFGHVRGAFTDAREDRPGRFEVASGGTLFLDEIGNLSLPMQAKLLNVLQNREVTRIGSNKPIPIDIRLICATNMPLMDMVADNRFRQDLLYRINTVEIKLPSLQERQKDIPLLTEHFIRTYSRKYHKQSRSITREAINKLLKYHWPGNIRELQHVIERVIIMTDGQQIQADDIILEHREDDPLVPDSLNLEDIERTTIRHALNKHSGNLSRAARELGVGRTTLYRKLSKYGI